MQQKFKRIAESRDFERFILGVILFAGILVGLETSGGLMERFGSLIHTLDKLVLLIFIAEIIIKMGAHGWNPMKYFKSPWNIFDFTIVAICLLPIGGQFAAVLRLARILRALRLISVLPGLQLLVGALIKCIPSMAYVTVLLLLMFYIYGVMGVFLFAEKDPVHFGNLGDSMLSLFRTVTMEDWTDLMYTQMYGATYDHEHPVRLEGALTAVIYFISFILLGTMIMLNLFIGVIMKGMEETTLETELAARVRHEKEEGESRISDDVKALERQIDDLKHSLKLLAHRIEGDGRGMN